MKAYGHSRYTVEVDQSNAVVKLTGDLTNEQSGRELLEAVLKLAEQDQSTVVLDLTEARAINSYGVGRVLECQQQLKERSKKLTVKSCGYSQELMQMLLLEQVLSK